MSRLTDRAKAEGVGRRTEMLYHKIETIYNRATDGTKKLIEEDWRNPTVRYLKDNYWEWTEKIDGTNIRIIWDGHNVSFGGRTERAQIPPHLANKLNELFLTDETEQLFEQNFGEKEAILFGEGYGCKIQNGGLYRSDVSFILFDVMINGNYQPRATVVDIATAFRLEIVPIVLTGDIDDAVEFVKSKPMSTIGTAPMEGLVGRPLVEMQDRVGNRVIVKIKVKDFAK